MRTARPSDQPPAPLGVVPALAVGLTAGGMAGFFGVGGGTIIVPALVWLGLDQRRAAATSLAAIVPAAVAAAVPYALWGRVDWAAAGLLVVGVVVGARIGARLLAGLPEAILRWGFACFLALVAVTQFVSFPGRDGHIALTWPVAGGLVGLGLATGVVAALLGIGGGLVVVPALSLVFGAGDLLARGTSLVMIIPGAVSGTIKNQANRLVNLRLAALIGLPAAAATPLGSLAARHLSPQVNTVLFGVYLAALVARSVYAAWPRRRPPDEPTAA